MYLCFEIIHASADLQKPGVLDSLELELQTVVSHPSLALGTKLGSFAGAVYAFNSVAISPGPFWFFGGTPEGFSWWE